MKITQLETFVIGDGPNIDPNMGGIEPLAILRVHPDSSLSGLAELFRMPPGVVTATGIAASRVSCNQLGYCPAGPTGYRLRTGGGDQPQVPLYASIETNRPWL